jgi:hypothetical protein
MFNLTKNNYTLFLIPNFAFFCAGILFVYKYGVNIPRADEWLQLEYICKMLAGTLRFIDLFTQQNEHRIFLFRLFYLLNYFIKPWSLVNIMYLSQLVILVTTCLLFLLVNKEVKLGWFTSIFIPAAMFSFVQFGSFLHSLCLSHHLFVMFSVAAIYSFFTINNLPTKITYTYLLSVFSLLSTGQGTLSFLIIVPLIMISMNNITKNKENIRKKILLIWFTLSFIALALYFYHFDITGKVLAGERIANIRTMFVYFIGFLGNIFYVIFGKTISRLAGFIILVLYLFEVFLNYKRYPKILSIASFGLLNGLLATISRANFLGANDAFSSRYTIYSLLTFIGIVLILIDKVPVKKIRRVIMYTILSCMIILSLRSIPLAENDKIDRIAAQEALGRIISTGDFESNYEYLWWYKNPLKNIFNLVKETKLDISSFTGSNKQAIKER